MSPTRRGMQLTLRGLEPEVERRLRRIAEQEGVSLNKAALRLLRRGAGLAENGGSDTRIGDSMDHLIGTWDETQEREFLDSIATCEQVDAEMWR